MIERTTLAIERDRAALLVVDIQERLAGAMPTEAMARVERNVCLLIEAARRLGMPVVVSQQYPKGLGPTLPAIEAALAAFDASGESGGDDPAAPARVHRFDKVAFSACRAEAAESVWSVIERDQWIVTGIENHVCVYQTARDLVASGHAVHVPQDAVASRTEDNWRVGLDLIARAGAVITSTEVVVFDALGAAGSPEFKALSRLIK